MNVFDSLSNTTLSVRVWFCTGVGQYFLVYSIASLSALLFMDS